ncbi:AMP-binding protein [Vibrio sp. CCB-PB317]|uniref:AMP-binding protein n=1 Tax=Vibrio sp. CCB-PB317 TaxID=2929171 RepID=UPI001FAE008C|nr:AMP-binding protein [Vibrio sp. CCB-PB317]MCJ0881070.1 AMP-binding protein [Vibrio sp. CCB-PB317]
MNTTYSSFTSLATLFVAERPEQSPVSYDRDTVITWGDFQQHVATLAQQLETQPTQNIVLCFGNSYLFAVGFFACCYAGKSIVLPGNYQPEALKELSDHYDLLLHDADVSVPELVSSLLIEAQSLLEITVINEPKAKQPYVWRELNLAEIPVTLFTSGSSGKPKAIAKTLKQLDIEVAILDNLWGDTVANTRVESTVSHQHIYGLLFRVLWPLCSARPFSARNLEFPEQIVHHADADTMLVSSPALLKRLNEEHNPVAIRCVFSSGGPLPNQAAQHSQLLFGSLPIEVFGSTETGGIAYRQQHVASTPWTLFPGVEAELNHENCLKLRSPHIDENTWYQTADECYFHDSISFELRGRTDRIVKVEEKRISLVEVEKRLEQLPWVQESVVIPMEESGRLTLVSIIVLNDKGSDVLNELGKGKFWLELRKALRNWLEPIAIPRKFRVVDEIPLNSQGKRQVAEIEKLFQ